MLNVAHLLTPGDFATVERQSRLSKIKSTQDLINRLMAECKAKPEGAKLAIGFLSGKIDMPNRINE